jgi:hypothetical protein
MARPEKYVIPKLDAPEVFYWGPEIDRQTARDMGLTRYFTGKPCKKNHVAERWVSSHTCIECVRQRHRTEPYREYQRPLTRESWSRHCDDYNARRRADRKCH